MDSRDLNALGSAGAKLREVVTKIIWGVVIVLGAIALVMGGYFFIESLLR